MIHIPQSYLTTAVASPSFVGGFPKRMAFGLGLTLEVSAKGMQCLSPFCTAARSKYP